MIPKRKRFENPVDQYGRVLRKRWITIALVFLAAVLVTTSYNLSLQPLYRTRSKLLIESGPARTGEDTGEKRYTVDYFLTQFEILKSGPILGKVADKLDLSNSFKYGPSPMETLKARLLGRAAGHRSGASRDALIGMLRNSVAIEPLTGTGLMQVVVRGSDGAQVRDICNTLVDTFIEENMAARMQSKFASTEYLSRQLAKLNDKISAAERKLEDYQKKVGIQGISDQATLDTQQVSEYIQKYMEAKQEAWELDARVSALKGIVGREDFEGITLTPLKNDTLDKLSQELFEAEVELSKLEKQDYKEKHPLVVQSKDKIDFLRRQIVHEAKRYITGLEAQLAVVNKRQEGLAGMYRQYQDSVSGTLQEQSEYSFLKRDIELHRSIYENYDQQLKKIQISDETAGPSVRVIEPAVAPGAPFSPNRRFNFLVGVAMGVVMGIFLAFLREYMDSTIRAVEDVTDYLEIPVLGTIPIILEGKKGGDVIQRKPASGTVVVESYRTLRTNLQFFETERQLRAIMVTSSGPGEGKSTTVTNLGLTLAQAGKRVCIVDTDLRKPTQHRLLRKNPEFGLTSVFAGITDKKKLLTPTGFDGLYLLACGPIPPNPAELLASPRMEEAIRNLKKDFDYVLFDSPPVLLVTDALVMGAQVDGVLLVIRAGEASIPPTQHALDSLHAVKANVIGAVLNRFDYSQAGYYYGGYSKYYSYGYGYRYGYGHGDKEKQASPGTAAGAPGGDNS